MPRIFLTTVLLLVCVLVGCSSDGRPKDLPKLYATTITITMDGQPLEGADVSLAGTGDVGRWAAMGTTDASGVAVIKTLGQYEGAPAGSFAVCVNKRTWGDGPTAKTPKPTAALAATAWQRKVDEEKFEIFHVDKAYKLPNTTPLKTEIKEEKNELSFEVKPFKK